MKDYRYTPQALNISKVAETYIGEFEEIVLLAICGLPGSAYAVSIQERIESRSDRKASLGSIYRTLNRLETKRLVTSMMGGMARIRGGKRKRFYEIAADGKKAVYQAMQVRTSLWAGLDATPSFLES